MIPVLIMWLLKKYLPNKQVKNNERVKKKALNKLEFIIICLLFSVRLGAQQQIHQYAIFYKGNDIGRMSLTQIKNGDELSIKIISNIKIRMLMTVKVNVAEEAVYNKDRLMHSSVLRLVNGKQKANRQTDYSNNFYKLTSEGKTSMLNERIISNNLTNLYLKEPVKITKIYSDNFQQYLNIINIKSHTYRLELPDGNYNIYHFEDGICNKVDVHSTFFIIQMHLIN